MAILIADIAFARNPMGNPGIVDLTSNGIRLVALVDGWGSWGNGMGSAASAQVLINARWRQTFPESLERAVDDMHEIANAAAARENDPDGDSAFHGVLLRIDGVTIQVAAAGAFPVILLSESRQDYLFKPRSLLDAYLEEALTPAEIEAFPHKHVYVGPLLGAAHHPSPMIRTSPRKVVPGESVVVARPTLLEGLAGIHDVAPRQGTAAAAALRDGDGQRWASPVVVISHRS